MKRRNLLALLSYLPFHKDAHSAAEPVLLTVSNHGINNQVRNVCTFTSSAFLALPQSTIKTATIWTPLSVFSGPPLLEVMRAAGITSGTLSFKTLDGYSVPVPWTDLVRYGVILAHSQNGERLDRKRWGPLWVIYPRDKFPDELKSPVAESRFIWQVNEIEVVA